MVPARFLVTDEGTSLDRNERAANSRSALQLAVQAALDGRQAKVWTALPAYATAFNAAQLTVSAQPTIQAQMRQPDGTWVTTALPLCVDCPVMFPGGGGYSLTFPIQANDEGLLFFASRCIDAWWQQGGIQAQAELRMHDLSDGFFLPTGGMSQPNVPPDVSTDGVELRSKDGTSAVVRIEPGIIRLSLNNARTTLDLDDALQEVQIVAINGLWVNGVKVVVP